MDPEAAGGAQAAGTCCRHREEADAEPQLWVVEPVGRGGKGKGSVKHTPSLWLGQLWGRVSRDHGAQVGGPFT